MKSKFQSAVLFSLMAVFLSACNETNQQLPQVADQQQVMPEESGNDAMDTAVAAGVGAAVGSIAGNMLSRPSTPQVQNHTTIVKQKVVVVNKPKTVVVSKPAPMVQKSRSSFSRSFSFRSSSRRGR